MLPYIHADRHGRFLLGYVRHAMLDLLEFVCKASNTPVPGFGLYAAYQSPRTTVAVSDASRSPSLVGTF